MTLLKWSEMFPNGRGLFYEGNHPAKFVKEMKKKFGFDPSDSGRNPLWNKPNGYQFHCPGSCIDKVYGTRCYPLGS